MLVAALAVVNVAQLQAQAPPVSAGDAKDYEAADELFGKKKFKEAAEALEKFLEKYKMFSPRSPDAKFRLAVSYVQLGSYDDAVKHLRELIANPKIEVPAREMAQLLVAKSITLKGFNLPTESDKQKEEQKTVFTSAIKEYDLFLTSFPKSNDIDSALFLRATLLLQSENYDEAVKGFGTMLRIPNSPYYWESQMWVGKTHFIQANSLLQMKAGKEPKPEDVQAALALFDKATPYLTEAYWKSGDVALKNEAVFFVGQMQLTRSMNVTVADEARQRQRQTAYLEGSLEAFRAVRSVEEVVEAQDAKIKDLERAIGFLPKGTPEYVSRKTRIENLINHEEEKKEKFKTGEDQYVSARLAIARIFLFLKKTDEARSLIRYLLAQKDLFEKDKESQATIAALLCLTYAEQRNTEKAVESYAAFRASFKGNTNGDNLPLLVSNLLVESGKPDEAEKVVAEGLEDYKDWRFTTESMRILTSTALKRNDYKKALELSEKVLALNPKPAIESQTLFIKASVQQAQALQSSDPALADAAMATFKVVRDKFPDTEQAEDAWFNSAQILAGRDPAKAIPELTGYLAEVSGGGGKSENAKNNIPTAQYLLGTAFDRSNQKDKAVEAWRRVYEKHPESEPAAGAYFKVFDALNEKKDLAGALKLMEEFLQKYPKHENAYFAYNNIAEFLFSGSIGDPNAAKGSQASVENVEAGAKKLLEFVDFETSSNPEAKRGDGSLGKIADRWIKELAKLPPFLTLNEGQRGTWQKSVDGVVGAVERLLKDYPESERLPEALDRLVTVQNARRKAQKADAAQVDAYFKDLTEKYGKTPLVKAKIQVAHASFVAENEPQRAFMLMDESFRSVPEPFKARKAAESEERVVPTFIPADFDRYLGGLFDAKRNDDLTKVIDRVRLEYPRDEKAEVAAAPASVRDAQAVALFWEAKLLQEQGKVADAGAKFASLKEKFPKSSKALESDYGVILGEFDQTGQAKDDYIPRLSKVVNTQTGKSFELQAKALFLVARIQEARKDYDSAIETYEKIQLRYASVPKVAAAGLWKAAELAEKQARGESGYPVKTAKEKRAAADERAAELKKAKDASKPEESKPAEAKPGEKPADPKPEPAPTAPAQK